VNVRVNGERRELDDGTSVADVVRTLTDAERGVAVAVDGEVVPRSAWGAVSLVEGQQIEVLRAVQGG
jgi:sulfur carrier protein